MRHTILAAALCVSLSVPGTVLGQPASQDDPVRDGIWKGALAGAAATAGLLQLGVAQCGQGCDADSWGAMVTAAALFGAAAGSGLGYAADRDARGGDPVSVRSGASFSVVGRSTPAAAGVGVAPGVAVAVQVSPHLSVHAEYTSVGADFRPPAGSVPSAVLENLVPAWVRVAGWERGVERHHVSFVFSELVGYHPRPFGPVRLELLGGLSVMGLEKFRYYDAYAPGEDGAPWSAVPLPGKYYVLNFETPQYGWVAGVDADVAVTRHLAVVPMLRYHGTARPGPSLTLGVGAHWRF